MAVISRRNFLKDAAALGLLAPLLAPCGGSAAPKAGEAKKEAAEHGGAAAEHAAGGEHTADGPHWTYAGEDGPEHWADLDPSFASCASGQKQTPINLSPQTGGGSDLGTIAFDYKPSKLNFINNGHTAQVNYDPGSFLVLDGRRYELLQFH